MLILDYNESVSATTVDSEITEHAHRYVKRILIDRLNIYIYNINKYKKNKKRKGYCIIIETYLNIMIVIR